MVNFKVISSSATLNLSIQFRVISLQPRQPHDCPSVSKTLTSSWILEFLNFPQWIKHISFTNPPNRDDVTKTQADTTKPYAYLMGYTVSVYWLTLTLWYWMVPIVVAQACDTVCWVVSWVVREGITSLTHIGDRFAGCYYTRSWANGGWRVMRRMLDLWHKARKHWKNTHRSCLLSVKFLIYPVSFTRTINISWYTWHIPDQIMPIRPIMRGNLSWENKMLAGHFIIVSL